LTNKIDCVIILTGKEADMARWGRPRSVDWRGLTSSPTSFCIFPIRDEEFSSELMVFMVYNHTDKGRRQSPLVLLSEYQYGDKKRGKPAGYGMPGGGINPEWLENPESAAIREGGNESGIRVINVRPIPIPGKKNKALILHKRTDELIRWVFYSDSQQESIELKPWEKVLPNPMNYYLAKVYWLGSKPREFFLNLKSELVSEGSCVEEDIARDGLSVNTLTQDELLELGVYREEVEEMGGFALLPVRSLRNMLKNKRFFLNPEESRENVLDPTSYVYKSHVERILQGLEIMGVD